MSLHVHGYYRNPLTNKIVRMTVDTEQDKVINIPFKDVIEFIKKECIFSPNRVLCLVPKEVNV